MKSVDYLVSNTGMSKSVVYKMELYVKHKIKIGKNNFVPDEIAEQIIENKRRFDRGDVANWIPGSGL